GVGRALECDRLQGRRARLLGADRRPEPETGCARVHARPLPGPGRALSRSGVPAGYRSAVRRLASTAVPGLAPALLAGSAAAGQSPDPRIVGGGKANAAGWQFAVALELRRHFICSGSLIAPDKVLTAAHCVKAGKRKRLSVLTGSPWISAKRRAP